MSSVTRMERVTMVDEDRLDGFVRNVDSRLQHAVTGMTGDAAKQGRGKANQATGQAQQIVGQVVDEIRQLTTDRPFGALLAALVVGVALGLIEARR